ncbi:MAG TPA: hypothetical protein VFM23_06535 [Gemmatimonadales bacterium]|nr:hypothetical protein [Gemmatimonadales bacterium]
MRVIAVLCCLLSAELASRPAAAQWRIGLELMHPHYRGTAVDTSGDPHFRPGNGVMGTLHLDRIIGSARLGWRLSYAKPGISLTGRDLTITDRSVDELLETGVTVGFRVGGGGIGSSGAVLVDGGPALHLWKVGDEIRARVGGLVDAAYEWPVSRRFTGTVRLEAMLSKSWFDAADVGPELRRQLTWRYAWGIGLRYRLT